MGKRAVAFLDILGFKNMLDSKPLEELAKKYERMALQAQSYVHPMEIEAGFPTLFPNRPPNRPFCIQRIFSDSIILIANEDSDYGCLELLMYAWRLTQHFLAFGMPLRGAIEYNEMYANPETEIFLGKALSRAYETEMAQDWIGVCINDSVADRYPDVFKYVKAGAGPIAEILKRYPVPFKKGVTKELHTLNWRFNYVVEKGTRSLFPPSPDPDVQRKIDNTLAYAKVVVDSGHIYTNDQDRLYVELRLMSVGAKEPPFPHGDDL